MQNNLAATEADFQKTSGTSQQIDLHLQAQSKAIDSAIGTFAVLIDFDGNSRPQGNGFDIGAYEYVTPAAVEQPIVPEQPQLRYAATTHRLLLLLPQAIQSAKVSIADLLGRTVYTQSGSASSLQEIALGRELRGSYFICIEYGGRRFVEKIVIY